MMDIKDIAKAVVDNDASLRAFVSASIRNQAALDDVMQDIWKAVVVKIEDYDATKPLKAWVFGIARLQVLKWRQSMARNKEYLLPDVIALTAETALAEADEIDGRLSTMKTCLDKLSPYSREVLNLRYYQGMKLIDIAQKLGKNVAAVEMSATRARRQLKDLMDEALRAEAQIKQPGKVEPL